MNNLTMLQNNLELMKHPENRLMKNSFNTIKGLKALLKMLNKEALANPKFEDANGRFTIEMNTKTMLGKMPKNFQQKHADVENYNTKCMPNLLHLLSLCGSITLLDWSGLTQKARFDRYDRAQKANSTLGNSKDSFAYMAFPNTYAINDLSEDLHWERLDYKMNDHTKLTYGAVATLYGLDTASAVFTGFRNRNEIAVKKESAGRMMTRLAKNYVLTEKDWIYFLSAGIKQFNKPNYWYRENMNALDALGYFKANGAVFGTYSQISDYYEIDDMKPNTKVLYSKDLIK